MPDRLDFDAARDLIAQIAPTDTWDEATERATADSLVALDTDEPTGPSSRHWLRSNTWLVAVAACVLAVVVLAAVVAADRQSVDTQPSDAPTTTDCPNSALPRAINPGGQMRNRFAAPVASAATAILLLGACSDDDPTTIAKGEDVELVGSGPDLGGQTLNIDVEEQDGEVTGEFRVTDNVLTVECVDTDTEGIVILGGVATGGPDLNDGELVALVIREGDPDSVFLVANDVGAESCEDLVDSISDETLSNDGEYVDVEAGSDIETG
jgi:hypothetical protein